jgi:hypothetical protein
MCGQYQLIVKNHLVEIFKSKPLVSEAVVFMATEKKFIADLAVKWGYTPVFGEFAGGYQTVNFIQNQPPC